MEHSTQPAAPKVRRPLSPAQVAVMPLRPIFNACKAKGLPVTDETRAARLYAVNRYLCNFDCPGFDWLETSFKELLGNTVAIIVLADAIENNLLAW